MCIPVYKRMREMFMYKYNGFRRLRLPRSNNDAGLQFNGWTFRKVVAIATMIKTVKSEMHQRFVFFKHCLQVSQLVEFDIVS